MTPGRHVWALREECPRRRGASPWGIMAAECADLTIADGPAPINAQAAPERYLSAWAESHAAPLALLSPDQRLIWANGPARAVFATGAPLAVREGVLTAADKTQAQVLRGFLDGVGESGDVRIIKSEGGVPMIVRAQRVRAFDGSQAIAISLFSTEPAQRYVWTNFGETFRLTRAEVEVAKRILEGMTADGAAEDLSVSVETVRTHIRSLYGKLSINSRERLFAVISPFRIG